MKTAFSRARGAVEAPVVLGDELGEGGFESANGSERPADVVTVLFGRLAGLREVWMTIWPVRP